MKEAKTKDVLLLLLLGAIWGSSFFNIKIATYSFEPYTLALIRVIFAAIFLVAFSLFYQIKINAFSKDWKIYALVGLCNIAIPFLVFILTSFFGKSFNASKYVSNS